MSIVRQRLTTTDLIWRLTTLVEKPSRRYSARTCSVAYHIKLTLHDNHLQSSVPQRIINYTLQRHLQWKLLIKINIFKKDAWFLIITRANVNRFSKCFHCYIFDEIKNVSTIKMSISPEILLKQCMTRIYLCVVLNVIRLISRGWLTNFGS